MKVFFNPNASPGKLYPMIPALLIRGRDVAIWNPEITDSYEHHLRRDIIAELLEIYSEDRLSICCSESYLDEAKKRRGKYAEVFLERIDHTTVRTRSDYEAVSDLAYSCWRAIEGERFVLENLLNNMIADMMRDKALHTKVTGWEKEANERFEGLT